MKRWIAVLGAAVLALSLAVSATAADTQPGKRKGGGVKRVENALAQLNLTTEQKPKVDKLVTDTKAELKTIRTSTGTPEDK
jgi:Spy/CpxP family protein refolding chaperone